MKIFKITNWLKIIEQFEEKQAKTNNNQQEQDQRNDKIWCWLLSHSLRLQFQFWDRHTTKSKCEEKIFVEKNINFIWPEICMMFYKEVSHQFWLIMSICHIDDYANNIWLDMRHVTQSLAKAWNKINFLGQTDWIHLFLFFIMFYIAILHGLY
jgi:hypothetical protein